jgi:PhzF family phenazine biosynthesis protein
MSGRSHRFHQLDVFSAEPLKGNPLAVVHDAGDWTDARMAEFARWTNLSETTFLLPPRDPAADYRVRIFTPGGELPFAGHPTLGSCHAWLAAGGAARDAEVVVQECGVGLVRIRRRAGGQLAFAAPPCRIGAVEVGLLDARCAALGLPRSAVLHAAWLDNGPDWLTIEVADAASVLALQPDHAALRSLAKVGIVGRHNVDHDALFEVRAFADPVGIPEDPVTGSLNAGVAAWLIGAGRAPAAYVAAQGTAMGRAGRVFVEQQGEALWIGGQVARCIEGTLTL